MKTFSYLAYVWQIECTDGHIFSQFDASGVEHRFSEYNNYQIKTMTWIPTNTTLKVHTITAEAGQKIIFFAKNFLSMTSGERGIAFVLGIEGQPLKYIFEDEIVEEI